jgi:hypothetical protein
VLFNFIQIINFGFGLILFCGTYDVVASISISISNSISTQPPSSAEVESVRSYTSISVCAFMACVG